MPILNIEYLKKFSELESRGGEVVIVDIILSRKSLCRKYSPTIPTGGAGEALTNISPLLEIGAGAGYWTMLVAQSGGGIISSDKKAGKGIKYAFTHMHAEVLRGDENIFSSMDKVFSLFPCCPNFNNDLAFNCLRRFKGNTLSYAGEAMDGCSANDKFFELTVYGWNFAKHATLPQWFGIYDSRLNGGIREVSRRAGLVFRG